MVSGKLLRWLALSVAVGGSSYAALVTSVNTAVSRLTVTGGGRGGAIVARVRLSSPVTALEGRWTAIQLTGATWTQPAGSLHLLAGTMHVMTPASCTGSIGNAMLLSVDGRPVTFASAPTEPGSRPATLPFVVGTLADPGRTTKHTLSAKFGSSCAGDGEHYVVSGLEIEVLEFR